MISAIYIFIPETVQLKLVYLTRGFLFVACRSVKSFFTMNTSQDEQTFK
jgi:hypothetical protein